MLVAYAFPPEHPKHPRGACGFHRKAGMMPLPSRTSARRAREDARGVGKGIARV